MLPVYDENGRRGDKFRPWVTWGIAALNVTLMVALSLLPSFFAALIASQFGVVSASFTSPENVDVTEGLVPPALTLLTYGFFHGNWSHLASNMIFLWVFGDNVEKAIGHWRFLAFYFLCQIAGGVAHIAGDPAAVAAVIGASAAVAGVVAGYLLVRPRARVVVLILGFMSFGVPAYLVVLAWVVTQVAAFLMQDADSYTAYWSHFGGFVAGFFLMLVMHRPSVKLLCDLPQVFTETAVGLAQRPFRSLQTERRNKS
jgi:membrane associated rhomboid family serine protease